MTTPVMSRSKKKNAVLYVGTQNVAGLAPAALLDKALAFSTHWISQNLHIVLIQETHLKCIFLRHKLDLLLSPWWRCFWCMNTTSQGRAGCAILIRKHMITSGHISVSNGQQHSAHTSCGRLLSKVIKWGGRTIQLASIYLPNESSKQKEFISAHLIPLCNAAPANSIKIWGGDFNFVENPSVDRLRRTCGILTPIQATTSNVGQHWKTHLPDMLDIFRVRYPNSKSMTRFDYRSRNLPGSGAARLDRFYVSSSIAGMVPNVTTVPHSASFIDNNFKSDHLLVKMNLLPVAGHTTTTPRPPPQQSLRRIRLWFKQDPELVEEGRAFIIAEVAASPSSPAALIKFWPQFKYRLASKITALNKIQRQRQMEIAVAETQDLVDKYTAIVHADLSTLAGIQAADEAIDNYMDACKNRAASKAIARVAELETQHSVRRRTHIHNNEVPNPALTAWLKPSTNNSIVALKSPSGSLVTSPQGCARLLIQQYSSISAESVVVPAAQQQVLDSITADDAGGLEAVSEELGKSIITEDEIKNAIKKAKPNTAPGLDGLPIGLYHLYKAELTPLLAKVFSAMGETNTVPTGFLDGVITSLFKDGDRTDPSNYRPITLLSTDYRLLATCLANRLAPHLHLVIDKSQSAYVPGRNIGDSIWLMQLLGPAAQACKDLLLCIFCDIKKAFDTVNRKYLFDALERYGVGPGFISWVKLLLSNTRAAAIVNGFLSDMRAFLSGVRQGCPLSPFLYLFIAESLLRFLRHHNFGVFIANIKLISTMHADDIKVFLKNITEVPRFLNCMKTFGEASNQKLAPAKSKILPLGAVPSTPLPSSIAGIPLVSSATSLGLTFQQYSGKAVANWKHGPSALISKLEHRSTRLARSGMSSFGMGFAVAGYVSSVIFFQCEYIGLPPSKIAKSINQTISCLIDRKGKKKGFAGVPLQLLAGNPKIGGFGAISIEEHLKARWAKWGLKFLLDSDPHPWILIGRACLLEPFRRCRLSLLIQPYRGDNQVLARLLEPVRQLPPLKVRSLTPGAWCTAVELWDNPTVPKLVSTTNKIFAPLAFTEVKTVSDAINAHARISELQQTDHHTYLQLAKDIFGHPVRWNQQIPTIRAAEQQLRIALNQLPQGWVETATTALQQHRDNGAELVTAEEATLTLCEKIGWSVGNGKDWTEYTVKWGTVQLSAHIEQQRTHRFRAYTALIGPSFNETHVRHMLHTLWAVNCDNSYKEVVWRLVLNGLPLAERMGGQNSTAHACGCGTAIPGRKHHYWECPAVQDFIKHLNSQFVGEWAGIQLQQQHVWLAIPPTNMHGQVWNCVCLAAISAIDAARRTMVRDILMISNRQPATMVPKGTKAAIATFWKHIAAFAGGGWCPFPLQPTLLSHHPFLGWQQNTKRLVVNRTPLSIEV